MFRFDVRKNSHWEGKVFFENKIPVQYRVYGRRNIKRENMYLRYDKRDNNNDWLVPVETINNV